LVGYDGKDPAAKHSSFVTIFSVWNAMVGAGLTTIPWAYQQSGILLGIGLTTIAFAASYWTCYLVVITAGEDVDYTDTL